MAVALRQLRNILRFTDRRRTIMTSPPKMEKALENLQKNPYYDKYADRIAALQKTSPEEFMQRVESQEKNRELEKKKKFAPVDTSKFSSVLNPKEAVSENAGAEEKKLEKIFKVKLVEDKTAEEIEAIWFEYHKNKEVISAIIPIGVYEQVQLCLKEHPTFLFPLPRDQGYEFIMCQANGNSVHFTPLLAYQVHKENAPECLTMVHYTEMRNKGIVLMRGEYDKKVISAKEAQCLANQFQMYYSGRDEARSKLLRTFTRDPATFRHMELIAHLENITLV